MRIRRSRRVDQRQVAHLIGRKAADFTVKMVLAAVRTAARDWMREVDSGEFSQELVTMLLRYLIAE